MTFFHKNLKTVLGILCWPTNMMSQLSKTVSRWKAQKLYGSSCKIRRKWYCLATSRTLQLLLSTNFVVPLEFYFLLSIHQVDSIDYQTFHRFLKYHFDIWGWNFQIFELPDYFMIGKMSLPLQIQGPSYYS